MQTASTLQPRTRRLTLSHVWVVVGLTLLALRPLLTPIPPHDFWWHMATGRWIVQHGAIPQTDSFSFTRTGAPFFNQSWLAQLLMYGVYEIGGLALIILVQMIVITATYGLLLRLCIRRTGNVMISVALLLMLLMPAVFDNWNVRPQTYAFPLFMGFVWVLTAYRLGWHNRLWLLPILMVLWVNVHGAFILGLGLIGLVWLGEALKRLFRRDAAPLRPLVIWGLATAAATLINPRGVGVLGYVRGLVGNNAVTSLVTEWAPPSVRDINGTLFFVFLLVSVGMLIYARRRPDLTDMLLCAPFVWLALGAGRNIVWLGFVVLPAVAVAVAGSLPERRTTVRSAGSPLLNGVLVGLMALMLVLALPWFKPALFPPQLGALVSEGTPVEAVAALRTLPQRPQRLFHAMSYGSYVIWAAPEQPVFIDPRIELYPYDQWVDYINLGQGNNSAALLSKYRIDGLLLSKKEQKALIEHVRTDPAWQVRYEDEQAIMLTAR